MVSIHRDHEGYREYVLDSGADRAMLIDAEHIVVAQWVRHRRIVPFPEEGQAVDGAMRHRCIRNDGERRLGTPRGQAESYK